MAKISLNVKTLAALKPQDSRVDYFDTNLTGFFVRVTPAGVKTFGCMYRIGRHLRRYTVGTVDRWTLADAREEAREALRSAAKGEDPALKKQADRIADTFSELVELYLAGYADKKKSGREDRRILNKYFLPSLKHVRAKHVTRTQIRSIVEGIAGSAPIMANRALASVRKMFNWAIGQDIVESNPCLGLSAPGQERRRDRVLSDDETKAAWNALEAEESPVADTYKLRLLTAQRGGEVLGMRWAEIDLKDCWWTIPAERSKNKMPHRVWLSDPVIRILKQAQRRELKREAIRANRQKRDPLALEFVFPGRRYGQPLRETKRVMQSLREASGVENWIGHDLRRTAATGMAQLGVPRFTIGRVLNHHEPEVTAVYDRASYDSEKKAALNMWAKRLMVIVSELREVETAD